MTNLKFINLNNIFKFIQCTSFENVNLELCYKVWSKRILD